MFILTEPTPNPEALKFIPEAPLCEGRTHAFERDGFRPSSSALAARLFEIEGVGRVFIAPEFVTVTRAERGPPWSVLRYLVIPAIADHLASGLPAVCAADEAAAAPDDAIAAEIREVLARHVKPGVSRDGGEILFERFDRDSGVLWIRMQGACGGCPSSRLTLKAGVEAIVRRFVPEVSGVEEIAGEASEREPAASRLKRWMGGLGAKAEGRQGPVFTHAGREMRRRSEAP